jgi:hypothetical protein
MSRTALALAGALLATTTFCSAASAGGIRLGMGGPLGSFTAHPTLSSGPAGTGAERHGGYERHCEPRVAARSRDYDPPSHLRGPRSVPKVEVADDQPAPHKFRHVPLPKEDRDDPPAKAAKAKPAHVETAKLEDKTTISDAAPSIVVPESPPQLIGTQSTPAPVHTASLGPVPDKPSDTTSLSESMTEPLKSEAAVTPVNDGKPAATEEKADKVEKVEKAEKTDRPEKSGKKVTAAATPKLCRKFSAAVAGMISVPCE